MSVSKMISSAMPEPETDPPPKNEVTGLTPEHLIQELFTKYRDALARHLRTNPGLTLNKVGEWLNAQDGYAERLPIAGLGGDGGATKILQALNFRLEGKGAGAKVYPP